MQSSPRSVEKGSILPSAKSREWRREARTPVNHRVAPLGATQATMATPLRKHALGLAIAIAVLPDVAVALSTRHTDPQSLADTTRHDIAVESEPLERFVRAEGNLVWKGPLCVTSPHGGKPCVVLRSASASGFC